MLDHCCCFLQEGNTALHIAAIHGHSTVAKLLIQNGSGVDIKNKVGGKPLHYYILIVLWGFMIISIIFICINIMTAHNSV